MILGLDVSTSVTGWAVIDNSGSIIDCGAIKLGNKKKYNNLFEKADEVEKTLLFLKEKYNIEKVGIETSLQMFRSGFSSAKTLATLSKFNGIVSFLCWRVFLFVPEYISAASARKRNGIKIEKGKLKAKEQVMSHFIKSGFPVEYTKFGNVKSEYYDIVDAIVIGSALSS